MLCLVRSIRHYNEASQTFLTDPHPHATCPSSHVTNELPTPINLRASSLLREIKRGSRRGHLDDGGSVQDHGVHDGPIGR